MCSRLQCRSYLQLQSWCQQSTFSVPCFIYINVQRSKTFVVMILALKLTSVVTNLGPFRSRFLHHLCMAPPIGYIKFRVAVFK